MPIEKTSVEMRLHPGRWPEKLDPQGSNGEIDFHKALNDARTLFAAFEALGETIANDPGLSMAGRRAKLQAFVDDRGTTLVGHLPKIEEKVAAMVAARRKLMDDQQAAPPVEAPDIAMMQEIRAWLRSLPEGERALAVRRAIEGGDHSALRAVLTAPAYLTEVDPPTLEAIRDVAFARADPERAERMRVFPQAAQLARNACEGVLEFMGDTIACQVEMAAPVTIPNHPSYVPGLQRRA
ncbi:hypothetical protein FV226_24305 [Methylobacterium sp. WL12]|uniref:hypothetical protein n=1 Tax=Methylobacterium sp. WL12 TaxID=2603890 RepID=UPI0011C78D84|nr:hypothetical protein [Methylobacterium sp. WL12]TXM65872.1 hypothetical protein FV226_24305 [Methylobacterium sp. WL12]